MISWAKRARVRQTDTCELRRYQAKQLPYAVVQVRSHYGQPGRWLAIKQLQNGNQAILGRHRTRQTAERCCQADMQTDQQ